MLGHFVDPSSALGNTLTGAYQFRPNQVQFGLQFGIQFAQQ
jgi:hypothetical protein